VISADATLLAKLVAGNERGTRTMAGFQKLSGPGGSRLRSGLTSRDCLSWVCLVTPKGFVISESSTYYAFLSCQACPEGTTNRASPMITISGRATLDHSSVSTSSSLPISTVLSSLHSVQSHILPPFSPMPFSNLSLTRSLLSIAPFFNAVYCYRHF